MLLQEIEMFYTVVKRANFSQAAEQLGVSKAHVSRGIKRLEADLKTQLLYRSTRKLSLTEAGEAFFQRCKRLMLEAENAYATTSHFQAQLAGYLRITVPPAFGNIVLTKFLSDFLVRYPEIRLKVDLSHQLKDLFDSGIDVAIRSAYLEDSQLIAQKLGQFSNVLCATPAYLKRYGIPKKPSDLKSHSCCTYDYHHPTTWVFQKSKVQEAVVVEGKIKANQLDFLKKMVLAHEGIGHFPLFMVKEALSTKQLIQCLPNYPLANSNLFALYPAREFLPQKTKSFIKELRAFIEKCHSHEVTCRQA